MEFIDRNEVLKILDKAIADNGGWKHLGADKLLKEVRNEIESVKTYLVYDEKSEKFRKG
jgi:hypothetical protein